MSTKKEVEKQFKELGVHKPFKEKNPYPPPRLSAGLPSGAIGGYISLQTYYDNLDRPHFNDLAAEIRKVADERFGYDAIIQSVVIYTHKGILSLKRDVKVSKIIGGKI